MTRAFRIFAAVFTVAALMGADGGCVRSDRPPQERKVDPKRERVVLLVVTEATGPYEVTVRAGEVGSDKMGDWSRERTVGSGYKQTLRYTSGLQIEIHMFVKGHADDHFACKISDGSNVDQRQGSGEVLCRLVTQR